MPRATAAIAPVVLAQYVEAVLKCILAAGLMMAGCASSPGTPNQPAAVAPSGAPMTAPAASVAPASEGGPVEQVCNASIDERVQRQLVQRAAQARHCYEALLQRSPTAHGRMLISVRLRSAGEIENAVASVDEVGDPDHTACVLRQFKLALAATFPGNCADVNIPLRFELKQDPADSAASSSAADGP